MWWKRTARSIGLPMGLPTVTFVIPCFNHGEFVAEAARSCLEQQDAITRVVIVDDGSDDGTTPAACDAVGAAHPDRVLIVHQPNRGLSAARNRGAADARKKGVAWAGEFLSFLDADDWVEPDFVAKLHAAMVDAAPEHPASGNGSPAAPSPASPSLGAVSHAYCQERLVGLANMIWAVPDWDPMLMMVTNLHPVTTLLRRDCFEAVGGFDASMRGGYEDWDLWLKFVERGWRGVRVREPLFTWRRHSQTSMIVEAGQQHARLYQQLVRNHAGLFARYSSDLLVIANTLLRRGEGNWLDESGEAIVQRDMRRHIAELVHDRDANAHAAQTAQALAASLDALLSEARAAVAARDSDLAAGRDRERAFSEQHRLAVEDAARLAQTLAQAEARERALAQELAQQQAAAARARDDAARLQVIYETKPIVRLSKKVYRVLDHMPGFMKRMVRGTVHSVANVTAPPPPPPGQ